jgi:hypothetical protein
MQTIWFCSELQADVGNPNNTITTGLLGSGVWAQGVDQETMHAVLP